MKYGYENGFGKLDLFDQKQKNKYINNKRAFFAVGDDKNNLLKKVRHIYKNHLSKLLTTFLKGR